MGPFGVVNDSKIGFWVVDDHLGVHYRYWIVHVKRAKGVLCKLQLTLGGLGTV